MMEDLIKEGVEKVFAELGKPCSSISIRRTKHAETEQGVSGDYDRAGEWQVECGSETAFVLTLTNAESKDPATRQQRIKAAIMRSIP